MSHSVRKVIKVGKSKAIVIPPHVLDHIDGKLGDYVVWDISSKRFAILSVAPVPPYEVLEQEEIDLDNILTKIPDKTLTDSTAGNDSGSPPDAVEGRTESTVQARGPSDIAKASERTA